MSIDPPPASPRARRDGGRTPRDPFLAALNHELRTPLNAVMGFTELVRDGTAGPLTARQREYLGYVHAASEALLARVCELIELAAVADWRLVEETVDLAEVVREGLRRVHARAAAAGLRLGPPPVGPGPFVRADPRHLRRLVLALLWVAIGCGRRGADLAVVCDAGGGAGPRLAIALSEGDAAGTGLALALAESLAALHGGRIETRTMRGRVAIALALPPERRIVAAAE